MKFTLSWLTDHLQTDAPLERIVETLTLVGLEVEDLHDPAPPLPVLKWRKSSPPHRIRMLTVCRSARFAVARVSRYWCAAPNARAGLKGILAQQGAVIPSNGMVLGKAKIRGVESNGMMCSAPSWACRKTMRALLNCRRRQKLAHLRLKRWAHLA